MHTPITPIIRQYFIAVSANAYAVKYASVKWIQKEKRVKYGKRIAYHWRASGFLGAISVWATSELDFLLNVFLLLLAHETNWCEFCFIFSCLFSSFYIDADCSSVHFHWILDICTLIRIEWNSIFFRYFFGFKLEPNPRIHN